MPVKRKQYKTNLIPLKLIRRSRVESVSDTQGSTLKRPCSGTRINKKEVNIMVNTKVDTKVKVEVEKVKKGVKKEEAGLDSEANVDSEADFKDN
jgi:hypothetical protein